MTKEARDLVERLEEAHIRARNSGEAWLLTVVESALKKAQSQLDSQKQSYETWVKEVNSILADAGYMEIDFIPSVIDRLNKDYDNGMTPAETARAVVDNATLYF